MAQGHPDRHAYDRDRRDSPSSLSFDQRKKQYLSNQKQKHVPLLSKSQQYQGGPGASGPQPQQTAAPVQKVTTGPQVTVSMQA